MNIFLVQPTDGRMDGRMAGRTDGRMDRQTDGRTFPVIEMGGCLPKHDMHKFLLTPMGFLISCVCARVTLLLVPQSARA